MKNVLFGLVGIPMYFIFVFEEWARTSPHYSAAQTIPFVVRVSTAVWILSAILLIFEIMTEDHTDTAGLVRLVSSFFVSAAAWHRKQSSKVAAPDA